MTVANNAESLSNDSTFGKLEPCRLLSASELKSSLRDQLRNDGTFDKIICEIRSNLINKFTDIENNEDCNESTKKDTIPRYIGRFHRPNPVAKLHHKYTSKDATPYNLRSSNIKVRSAKERAVQWLILEYLKDVGMVHTQSIFVAESGCLRDDSVLSHHDCLVLLGIKQGIEIYSQIEYYMPEYKHLFERRGTDGDRPTSFVAFAQLICTKMFRAASHHSRSTQTHTQSRECLSNVRDGLDLKLMKLQLKYESNLKSEASDNDLKFKDHCRRFENECSAQCETEKATEIDRFKKEYKILVEIEQSARNKAVLDQTKNAIKREFEVKLKKVIEEAKQFRVFTEKCEGQIEAEHFRARQELIYQIDFLRQKSFNQQKVAGTEMKKLKLDRETAAKLLKAVQLKEIALERKATTEHQNKCADAKTLYEKLAGAANKERKFIKNERVTLQQERDSLTKTRADYFKHRDYIMKQQQSEILSLKQELEDIYNKFQCERNEVDACRRSNLNERRIKIKSSQDALFANDLKVKIKCLQNEFRNYQKEAEHKICILEKALHRCEDTKKSAEKSAHSATSNLDFAREEAKQLQHILKRCYDVMGVMKASTCPHATILGIPHLNLYQEGIQPCQAANINLRPQTKSKDEHLGCVFSDGKLPSPPTKKRILSNKKNLSTQSCSIYADIVHRSENIPGKEKQTIEYNRNAHDSHRNHGHETPPKSSLYLREIKIRRQHQELFQSPSKVNKGIGSESSSCKKKDDNWQATITAPKLFLKFIDKSNAKNDQERENSITSFEQNVRSYSKSTVTTEDKNPNECREMRNKSCNIQNIANDRSTKPCSTELAQRDQESRSRFHPYELSGNNNVSGISKNFKIKCGCNDPPVQFSDVKQISKSCDASHLDVRPCSVLDNEKIEKQMVASTLSKVYCDLPEENVISQEKYEINCEIKELIQERTKKSLNINSKTELPSTKTRLFSEQCSSTTFHDSSENISETYDKIHEPTTRLRDIEKETKNNISRESLVPYQLPNNINMPVYSKGLDIGPKIITLIKETSNCQSILHPQTSFITKTDSILQIQCMARKWIALSRYRKTKQNRNEAARTSKSEQLFGTKTNDGNDFERHCGPIDRRGGKEYDNESPSSSLPIQFLDESLPKRGESQYILTQQKKKREELIKKEVQENTLEMVRIAKGEKDLQGKPQKNLRNNDCEEMITTSEIQYERQKKKLLSNNDNFFLRAGAIERIKEREQKEEQANIVLLGKLSGGDPREERPEKRIAHLHDLASNKEGKKMYNEESKSPSTYTSSAVETTSSAFGTSMEVGSSTGLYSNDSDW